MDSFSVSTGDEGQGRRPVPVNDTVLGFPRYVLNLAAGAMLFASGILLDHYILKGAHAPPPGPVTPYPPPFRPDPAPAPVNPEPTPLPPRPKPKPAGPPQFQCRDQHGQNVDFFYAFKHPLSWDKYHYMDMATPLTMSDDDLYDDTSPLSRLLDMFYQKQDKGGLTYALWNDQPPGHAAKNKPWAHAKGILAFNGKTGFWLTHSVPKFPQPPPEEDTSDSYEDSKKPTYAQTFMCISIDAAGFKTISKQLNIDRPAVYEGAEDGAKMNDENFQNWAMDRKHPKEGETAEVAVETLKSLGGQEFTVFAKSAYFGKDLYAFYVAPELKKNMIAETWQNGVGKMVSSCVADFNVYNSKELDWPDVTHEKTSHWTESKDHSKWTVSEDGEVFCVGDINRQIPQNARGGGTTCIKEPYLAKQIRKVVKSYTPCPGEDDEDDVAVAV